MCILGAILGLGNFDDGMGGVFKTTMYFLGPGMYLLGSFGPYWFIEKFKKAGEMSYSSCLSSIIETVKKRGPTVIAYPFLVILSPLIFLFIKLQSVINPNNSFIKHQAKTCSIGESVLGMGSLNKRMVINLKEKDAILFDFRLCEFCI